MRHHIAGEDVLYSWIDTKPPIEQVHALLAWLMAAALEPDDFTSGELERVGRGRRLRYAVVPPGEVIVTFLVMSVPVRVLRLVGITSVNDE